MSALVQQTPEWVALRKNKIGASDAPIIMQMSPFRTAYQLWEEKMGISNCAMTGRMRRGLELEETARQSFEDLMGMIVFPKVVFHPHKEFMMASLDGISLDEQSIVEIKCPGVEDHSLAQSGVLPQKYFAQIQHQLECCNLDKAYYYSFDGTNGVVLEVQRDDQFIKQMVQAEERFYYDYMLAFEPPPLTERDYIQKTDDIWISTASEYRAIKEQLTALEKKEKELKELLVCMSKKSNAIGGGIKLSKTIRKGAVNYAAVPQLQGLNLEPYRRCNAESWRISFC